MARTADIEFLQSSISKQTLSKSTGSLGADYWVAETQIQLLQGVIVVATTKQVSNNNLINADHSERRRMIEEDTRYDV
jgi:hypothetical protein